MIFELLTFAIMAIIWTFCGLQIIKMLNPNSNFLTNVTFGAILGEVLFIFFINTLSYLMPLFFSSMMTLALFLIFSIIIQLKTKYSWTKLGPKDPYSLFLFVVIFTIVSVMGINLFFGEEINYDLYFHQNLPPQMAEGNFPPYTPMNPEYPLQYHYGIDLLSASLISLSGIKPWNAINLLILWNMIWAFSATFLIGRLLSKNSFTGGLLAAIFLFFGEGLRFFEKIISAKNFNETIHPEIFLNDTVHGFASQVFHNPSIIAVPLMLLIFWLIYIYYQSEKMQNKLIIAFILSLTIGSMALFSEELFVIISMVLALIMMISLLINLLKKQKKYYSETALIAVVIFVAAIIALFQGGIITQAVFGKKMNSQEVPLTSFEIREQPGFVYWKDSIIQDGFIPISYKNASWITFLLTRFGPVPFLFPIMVIIAFKATENKAVKKLLTIMTLIALSSFFIPLIIKYQPHDVDMVRFFAPFKDVGNVFLGATIGLSSTWLVRKRLFFCFSFILLVAYATPIIFLHFLLFDFQSHYTKWGWNALSSYMQKSDIIVGEEVKKLTPKKSRLLTTNFPTVPMITGRFAPFSEGPNSVFFYSLSEEFLRLFPQPKIEDLEKMKIDFIYFMPTRKDYFNYHYSNELGLNLDLDIQYLNNHPEDFLLIKDWNINNEQYALYKVLYND